MKITRLMKFALLIFALSGFVACTSTSEEPPDTTVQPAQDSPADAATPQARTEVETTTVRTPAEEEQIRRSALATRVFYFDFDIADFRQTDRDTLAYHARELAANPNRRIRLEGHADERGTREYNLALGERRANGILNYLIVNGAARSQIETVSYGEERPADRGTGETAYQRNRRVEIINP